MHFDASDKVDGHSFEKRSVGFSPDGLERCFGGVVTEPEPGESSSSALGTSRATNNQEPTDSTPLLAS
jgi:hypothetical protein